MDLFLPENQKFFLNQVTTFDTLAPKETPKQAAKGDSPDSDTVIGARIRPVLDAEKENGHIPSVYARSQGDFADVHELRRKVNGRPAITTSSFQFDRIYGPDSSSHDIYEDLVAPLVPWAWGGGISTLFAYGQTGSGKTFTVDELERKAAEHLFGGLDGNRDVYVCVFELEGNTALDLLNDRRKISIMEDSFGESQLVGALEPQVTSAEELLALIERSMTFRKSAPTLKNESSSRTHAVCRIRIVNKDVHDTADGLLFLIDLAGSEAAADIKDHSQERMKEAREINTSLSTLKDCIRGRSMWYAGQSQANGRSKQVHIPYRNSAITKVLKHVFDTKGQRHCKTAVVACVSPSFVDAAPTKNTFRYAELLRVSIPPFKLPPYQEHVPSTWSAPALRTWIESNSGDPAIDPSLLAVTENGIQICRLPKGEFVSRCLKTPGVNEQQARAFYDKIWRLHIDSRKGTSGKQATEPTPPGDAQQKAPTQPFYERIRAGMFVQRKCVDATKDYLSKVMIMAPEGAFGDASSNPDGAGTGAGERAPACSSQRYICALVLPSPMGDAYEIDVNHQGVVGVDEMEMELLMEYDQATRCYYINL